MASDYIKHIRLDEKKNKIIADVADGNIYPLTFLEDRELYSHIDSYEEKYSTFINDLISGVVRCKNESNKLAKLECAKALKNYNDDYRVLGPVGVYRKYKDVINQILNEGLENDKQVVIPSEVELHYKMVTLPNKSFKDIRKIFYSLEEITENKNLTITEKKKLYNEKFNKELNEAERKKPIFIQYNKDNPEIIVCVYPVIKKNTYKEDFFLTYYFDIKNIKTNFEKVYDDIGMMISYILDDEIRTQRVLHGMEQQFIEDEKFELIKSQEEQELEEIGEQE